MFESSPFHPHAASRPTITPPFFPSFHVGFAEFFALSVLHRYRFAVAADLAELLLVSAVALE